MKKHLAFYITIVIITLSFATSGYAQLGNILNKTKDAIEKKKDKKKQDEQTTNQPTNSDSSNNNLNATKPNTQSATESPLGTIYFSNQPFPAGGGTEGAKTSFSSNEYVYGRLVLKGGTVREILKPDPPIKREQGSPVSSIDGYSFPFKTYYWDMKGSPRIAGLGVSYAKAIIPESDLDKTYLDFELLPEPSKSKTVLYDGDPMPANDFYKFLINDQTDVGKYTFGVEIKSIATDFRGNRKPEAEWLKVNGEFSYAFGSADYANIKTNSEKLTSDFKNRAARDQIENQQLPPEWNLGTNPIFGGLTELKLKTMYVNSFTSGGGSNLKMVKLYAFPVSQFSWTINKNDIGLPTYRDSNQNFTVFVKNIGAGNCFYQTFNLFQTYAGGGTFSETKINHGKGSYSFTCDKIGVK